MPRFSWSHHWRARHTPVGRSSLIHRQSSGTYYHTRLLKQKKQLCVFAKRIKGRPAQKIYPDGGEDDELIIAVGPPLRHLRRRDDATVHDIVVVERARHVEYR
jgi:hypothetical protein